MLRIRKGIETILRLLVILDFNLQFIDSIEKHWLGKSNWHDKTNWKDGVLPKNGSRLTFPTYMRHALGMPPRLALILSGIELTNDGELALPLDGDIAISDNGNVPDGQKATWLRDSPYYWVDPGNWNGSNEAVPHLERLPCQRDQVVLPRSDEVFSAQLPASRDVEVNAVRLADDSEALQYWRWKLAARGAEFRSLGYGVEYSPLKSCERCPCQEGDLGAYSEEICDVQRLKCSKIPNCQYPLKVEGHCCYYCGGRLRVPSTTLNARLTRIVESVMRSRSGQLAWHSRLAWDGSSREILLAGAEADAYEPEVANAIVIAVAELRAALMEEKINVLYVESSGEPLGENRLLMALGPLLGWLLVLLVVAVAICPLFGYSYSQVWSAVRDIFTIVMDEIRRKGRKKSKSYAFARFENVGKEGIVQFTDDEAEETRCNSGERFENPLYGSRKRSLSEFKELAASLAITAGRSASVESIEEIEMGIEQF